VSRLRFLLGINVFWLALSMLFDGLSSILLPAHLLGTLGEASVATTLGIITFAGLFIAMLVQPVAGLFSDRLRPRWGRRGTIGLGVLLTLAGLALFGAGRTLLLILAGYVLVQVAASIAQAAQQAFIPDQVEKEARGVASGVKSLMDLGGALLGFALLGSVVEAAGIDAALLALAAILLMTFLLTVVLVREPTAAEAPVARPPARGTLRRAFQIDLRRHRAFVWLVFSRFLFLLGTYAVGRFLLLFMAERLNLAPGQAAEEAGLLLGILTLATLVATVPAGILADRFGRLPLMAAGGLLSAAGVLPLIWADTALEIALFGSLMSLGSAAFASANWALTADLVPDEEAARFFALANFGTAGAAALAGLFGPLVDAADTILPGAGFPFLFMAATVALLASTAALRPLAASRAASFEPA